MEINSYESLAVGAGTIFSDPTLNGGTLDVKSGGIITGDIKFTGTGSTLIIEPNADGSTTVPANTITGFTIGDTIKLAGISFTSTDNSFGSAGKDTYTIATDSTLTIDADGTFYSLFIDGATIGQDNFILNGDLGVTEDAACFAAGTRICKADGSEVAVEDLRAGDAVRLAGGGSADIIWLGYRTVELMRHPRPAAVQPILITAGALEDGLPKRDLLVSPDHAMYLEGHLIPAKALTNGFTIRQLQYERVTYYHIELPAHGVILAEGVAAESYLDSGNRAMFENGGAAISLHPDFAQTFREQNGYAIFAEDGDVVRAVRQQILDRARIETSCEPELHILYKDDDAIIVSRSAIPGEIFGDPRDRRLLGVKIASMEIAGRHVSVDHPALKVGWHDMEADGRWTDGRAVIPAHLLQGTREVQVKLAATLMYPVAEQEEWNKQV